MREPSGGAGQAGTTGRDDFPSDPTRPGRPNAESRRDFSNPTSFVGSWQGARREGARLTGRPRTLRRLQIALPEPGTVWTRRGREGWEACEAAGRRSLCSILACMRGCTGGTLRRRRGPRSPGRNLSGPNSSCLLLLAMPPPASCTRIAPLPVGRPQARLLPPWDPSAARVPRVKSPRRRNAHFRTWRALPAASTLLLR